ncbi:MAG TPA: hypothetical protein VJM32_04415 [Candidatus Saccharimonadales bacterium]|nr:hypothetical protein [Candidatus Saccharimonadales bacterium]
MDSEFADDSLQEDLEPREPIINYAAKGAVACGIVFLFVVLCCAGCLGINYILGS